MSAESPAISTISLPAGVPRAAARHWSAFAFILLAGVMALALDLPLSQAMVEGQVMRPLHDALNSIEPFGRPPAVIAVSLAVLSCAGVRRGAGFRIVAAGLAPGLLVDILKLCVARVRPRHVSDFHEAVLDTFHGAFPGIGAGSEMQSWPSGHTAVAVGFCLALSAVFPRGRWLFRILAALVALQRIESGAHYLSDTLFAAAIAYAVVAVVFGRGPIGRWFDRVEARWASQSED
jgi:membrane-associated phospholipid phosphatase